MAVIANPLLPGIVRVVFGGALFVVAVLIWLAIAGHLRSGKVQLRYHRTFDRQQQAVDYWITLALAGLVSLGVVVFGFAILLGWLPAPRVAPTRVEPTKPMVEGLILPTHSTHAQASPTSVPAAQHPPTTPRAPRSP